MESAENETNLLKTAHQLKVGANPVPSQYLHIPPVSQLSHSLVPFPHKLFKKQTEQNVLHGILLEKQNVKTSMYNLECRSTE